MRLYRARPLTIEAVQLRWSTWNEVCELLHGSPESFPADEIPAELASDTCGEVGPTYIALQVRTIHGELATVRHGDYIVPESAPGRFYPVKPAVFDAKYEALNQL